jgi:glycosyltransferase involved in cell wall biosynthesis
VKFLDTVLNIFAAKKKIKIGWLLLGDINTGSSRIHGINIHNDLLARGIESVILQTNSPWNVNLTISSIEQEIILNAGFSVLIFQKVFGGEAVTFARRAQQKGIKTILLLADRYDVEMVTVVDQLVVTSVFLQEYLKSKINTEPILLEDAIEVPESLSKCHSDKDNVQLVWVGHSDNWKSLEIVYDSLERTCKGSFSLKTISNHPEADVIWDLNTVFNEALTGDIAVIPALHNEWSLSKSNNRLTMFMALGIPVVASSIPAYQNIIETGVNGFLAEDGSDWLKYLNLLKDTTRRSQIARRARIEAFSMYNISKIGKQWSDLLQKITK